MKKLTIALTLILFTSHLVAQDFPYSTYSQQELSMKKYDKDTSAHAVVLAEYGNAHIQQNLISISLVFEYHVKIKILDSKGMDKANIEIPIYKGDDNYFETVSNITGVTSYTDEHGATQHSDLDPSKVFTVNQNKYHDLVKFAMPNVRAGSIIEYKFKLESPYIQTFRTWMFQTDIPKVYSEYQTVIPAIFNYNVSLKGDLKLSKNNSEIDKDCFTLGSIKCDCTQMTCAMNDIPAFIEEDYMTAPKNFLSGIYFELADRINFNTGLKEKISLEWSDVDYKLKHDENFGSQTQKNILKDHIAPVIADKTDPLDKAKAIYAYIQKNIKWNGFYTIYSDAGIRKAFDKHTGMVADVNLALISGLKYAGLNAEAVLLSTRDHGIVNKAYPIITEFDYVIAKVDINNKTYLLDATDPLLSFGMLPLRCLNDQGRVMSMDKPSYWIDLKQQQIEGNTYVLDLTLQENGKLTGTLSRYYKGYAAYIERQAIKKFNSADEYAENWGEKLPKIKILKSDITNIDSLDAPLVENYQLEINAYDNLNHDKLVLNPFIFDKIVTNPFKLADRTYPVDWGMPSENRFVLNMHLPDGYSIENPPQSAAFALPNQGGRFIIDYSGSGNAFTLSHVTNFNKSIYNSAEYPYLKELYNKIILSEKSEIVFKKNL